MNIDIQNPPNLCFSVFGPPYSNPNCGNAPKKGRSDTFTSRLLLDGISIFEFQWYFPATRLLWKWVGVVFLTLLVILTHWYYYTTILLAVQDNTLRGTRNVLRTPIDTVELVVNMYGMHGRYQFLLFTDFQ